MIWRWLEGFSGEAELLQSVNGQQHLCRVTGSLARRLSCGRRQGSDGEVSCREAAAELGVVMCLAASLPTPKARCRAGRVQAAAWHRVGGGTAHPPGRSVAVGCMRGMEGPFCSWWDALPSAGSLRGNSRLSFGALVHSSLA